MKRRVLSITITLVAVAIMLSAVVSYVVQGRREVLEKDLDEQYIYGEVLEKDLDEQYIYGNVQDAPHPFAIALMEYLANYDGVVHAYLATLDDYGTIGVLTTRPTTRILVDYDFGEYAYGPSSTLFYIQDGDLFQIDVSSYWLFVSGRCNRLMQRIYAHTHIVELIYKVEFGRLEVSARLDLFSDEYMLIILEDYDAVARAIAERDALVEHVREKYGLAALPYPYLGHMRNAEHQTDQILAMTLSCVPSFNRCTSYEL